MSNVKEKLNNEFEILLYILAQIMVKNNKNLLLQIPEIYFDVFFYYLLLCSIDFTACIHF